MSDQTKSTFARRVRAAKPRETRYDIANRAMPVLSMMMRMAELWGYRAHNSNPCKNAKRYRMEPKERFLTAEEMARLNTVLTRDEFWCPNVVAVVRLLMLTGCRFGEISALEWDWIKDKRIHLPDSKSGPRTVWLSSAARAVIDAIPRYDRDCPYLFPARPPTRPIDNIASQWNRIRDEAGLSGLRLHDLRHSCTRNQRFSAFPLPINDVKGSVTDCYNAIFILQQITAKPFAIQPLPNAEAIRNRI